MRRHVSAALFAASVASVATLLPREARAQQPVPVRVQADQPDVQLLLRVGQSELEGVGWGYRGAVALEGMTRNYAQICTAPCDTQLPGGVQRLALSEHGGRAVEADDPVVLRGPSTIYAHYDSHAAIRTVGYVVMIGSLVGSIALVFTSFDFSCTQAQHDAGQCNPVDTTQLIAGLAVGIAGGIIGGVLAGIGDHATVQLVPTMSGGPLRLPGASESIAAAPLPGTPGLGLRMRF